METCTGLSSREEKARLKRKNRIATIDDVFRWALTSRGGMQFDIDYDEPVSCSMGGGYCE